MYRQLLSVTAVGYVASASFLERLCSLVKEVREHNPSVKYGKDMCLAYSNSPEQHGINHTVGITLLISPYCLSSLCM